MGLSWDLAELREHLTQGEVVLCPHCLPLLLHVPSASWDQCVTALLWLWGLCRGSF